MTNPPLSNVLLGIRYADPGIEPRTTRHELVMITISPIHTHESPTLFLYLDKKAEHFVYIFSFGFASVKGGKTRSEVYVKRVLLFLASKGIIITESK